MPEKGEASVGGHANLVIGYDDTKKIGASVGALLSRNSWGEGWGQDGDLWLP
jgi:C1A family cysteine protease